MAPPLHTSHRRSEGTVRCASSSSTPSSKESSREPPNRAQTRRFHPQLRRRNCQFRPPSSSSGQTEHTTSFPASSRTPDAISRILVRPVSVVPVLTCKYPPWFLLSLSSAVVGSNRARLCSSSTSSQQRSDLMAVDPSI
ncbi:uncharacterized protein LOC124683747 [Lolium rigidum]|uniref:uncharacterized protein LOC124683747 n=1 Tax=Lolium rigidum TaxID=89674 RepID=UPI001F5D3DED|nr:uncharacterized protein LOC124683747 [Lolium rigidum]